jgi:hypothetical protein
MTELKGLKSLGSANTLQNLKAWMLGYGERCTNVCLRSERDKATKCARVLRQSLFITDLMLCPF